MYDIYTGIKIHPVGRTYLTHKYVVHQNILYGKLIRYLNLNNESNDMNLENFQVLSRQLPRMKSLPALRMLLLAPPTMPPYPPLRAAGRVREMISRALDTLC